MDDDNELYILLGFHNNTYFFQHFVSNFNYSYNISKEIFNIVINKKEEDDVVIYEINPLHKNLYIIFIKNIKYCNSNDLKYNLEYLSKYYINLFQLKNIYITQCIKYNYVKNLYYNYFIDKPLFLNNIPEYIPPFSNLCKIYY
jgi:hypothetical protein